jgi:hypothetical protein
MAKANTSTPKPADRLSCALKGIRESKLRHGLTTSYLKLKQDHIEGRFDAVGLNAGKFCEAALRIAQDQLTGTFAPLGSRIPNFADAVRSLVTAPAANHPESLREIVPRALLFLYTLRNKRGIGHLPGEVDANRVDAMTIVQVADWVMCELIRLYHGLSLEEAQELIDSLAQRQLPMVWEVAGRRRVLREGFTKADETLLLLYGTTDFAVLAEDLCAWVEYSVLRLYKKNVLEALHKQRFVEYDRDDEVVHLSPLGVHRVESHLLRPTLELLNGR